MKQDEVLFSRDGGTRLYCRSWHADAPARGVIVIVHGVGEHIGRYMNLVLPLTSHGYEVCGYDHRGHGRSSGQRVHVGRWCEYREDLAFVLDQIAQRRADQAIFLYGHSMGALVVLDFLLRGSRKPAGAMISGAPIEPGEAAQPWRIAMARGLSRVWPRCTLALGLKSVDLSRDPDVVRAYDADPGVAKRATARWCAETLDAIARTRAHAAELKNPLLLLHGGADRVNLPGGTRFLQNAVRNPAPTVRIYPGGYHEPHNDLQHDQVAADVIQWLDRQTSREVASQTEGIVAGESFGVPGRAPACP
jgi:alpha-beta hydrolase superfamily lysophospholipase